MSRRRCERDSTNVWALALDLWRKAEYGFRTLYRAQVMILSDGKPITRDAIRATVAIYNTASRGSKEFSGIPRALVTILDNLSVGKTTYVMGSDGKLPINRRKDKTVVAG